MRLVHFVLRYVCATSLPYMVSDLAGCTCTQDLTSFEDRLEHDFNMNPLLLAIAGESGQPCLVPLSNLNSL